MVAPLNEPETYTELCFICDASFKNSKAPLLWKRCQFNDLGISCPNFCCGECGPRNLSDQDICFLCIEDSEDEITVEEN